MEKVTFFLDFKTDISLEHWKDRVKCVNAPGTDFAFPFILSLYFLFLNQTATNVKILPLHVFSSVQAFVTQPSLDGLKKETQPTRKGKGDQETISKGKRR